MVSGCHFKPLTQKFTAGLKTGAIPASSLDENDHTQPVQSPG